MDASEKARKQREALAQANKGLEFYNQKKYVESEKKFCQSR